jgi:hypothetical protein
MRGGMALYGNTCMKDCMAFRMPVQLDSDGTISYRPPPIRLQKQAVGEPRRSLSIGLRTLPCEEPVYGRRNRRGVAQLQLRGGRGKKKTRCSPRLGGARQHRPGLCAPFHETLPVTDPSRRIASTAAMRSPKGSTSADIAGWQPSGPHATETASMPEHTDRYLTRHPVVRASGRTAH